MATNNKKLEIENASLEAKNLLKDGKLLETTEAITLQLSNNYDFARRIGQEIALDFAGQAIKHLYIGQKDRAYSHSGILAPPGMGKDFAYDLMVNSGIFPTEQFEVQRLDNITSAALEGTIFENKIVPPPTITCDLISTTEWASLSSGSEASSLLADLRILWEKGEYTRRLAKLAKLDMVLKTGSEKEIKYVQRQLENYEKLGMLVDTDNCKITVKSTTSWFIASADFGSQSRYKKSLLNLGDLNRIRWRTYLPDKNERRDVVSDVGSLPPLALNRKQKEACCEAWTLTIEMLKELCAHGVDVPRDSQSYYERQKIWNETTKEMLETYTQLEDETYYNQLMSLRNVSEFRRLMYQHAALKQFTRNNGNDLSSPNEFKIDYKEDGAFAKRLWIDEYVPSMIDIINNVLSESNRGRKKVTKTELGIKLVLQRLSKGSAKRNELVEIVKKHGISSYTLDNQILPYVIERGLIKRIGHGVFDLPNEDEEMIFDD